MRFFVHKSYKKKALILDIFREVPIPILGLLYHNIYLIPCSLYRTEGFVQHTETGPKSYKI